MKSEEMNRNLSILFNSFYEPLYKIATYLHYKLENYIDQTHGSDDIKIKKKMLLYHTYTTVLYSLCVPIFNPYASTMQALVHILIALCQIVMIRIQNYYILVSYFVMYTFLSIYLPARSDDECLNAIGAALMHHNLFFLFPDNVILKLGYIFISLGLLKLAQINPFCIPTDSIGNAGLEMMIKNFYYIWPLIYIVNHVNSMYLVKAFQNTMQVNKIIEQKANEINKKLHEANEKLSVTLAALEKTNQELKATIKARELFIAGASHELRNPLNAMMGNIDLAILETKDSKLITMLETCKVCGEVLLAFINNILDMAKINAGKLELHYTPINFLKLVEKVWNISTLRIKQKGLEGELYIAHDFPKYLEMDSHRLMQVLLNILGNATKFTSRGFIKVVITWHENEEFDRLKHPHEDYLKQIQKKIHSSVKISSLRSDPDMDDLYLSKQEIQVDTDVNLNDESLYRILYPKFLTHVLAAKATHLSFENIRLPKTNKPRRESRKKHGIIKIEIVDTGCGISPKTLKRLFQPFCQGDPSITQRFGGTGLGLYITQQLVEKMGGKIHVYSQESVGTNFCILLTTTTTTKEEVRDKEVEDMNPEEYKSRVSRANMRALVADDDPINRAIICGYLEKLNIQVDSVCDGIDAVEKYKSQEIGYYSFITMDLLMPEMDGFTASREIRKYEKGLKVRRPIPIVVVTGNCTEQERVECLDPSGGVRALCFYRKPFTFKDCKIAVQSVLRKKRSSSSEKLKVLAVDDDPFNATLLQEFLTKNGLLCDTCNNGKEAMEMVLEETYNVVLMDSEMPEMDGYTAARLIKQRYPELLIIGITGHTDSANLAKCRRSGMNLVESKPINLNKLLSLIVKEAS